MIYLKYIGAGSYLPDVPARDLTKEEAEYHGVGRLIDSHLYESVGIIEIEEPLSDEQADELKAKWNEAHQTDTQYGSAKKRGKQ